MSYLVEKIAGIVHLSDGFQHHIKYLYLQQNGKWLIKKQIDKFEITGTPMGIAATSIYDPIHRS
jgi:hypothetical protein